MLQLYIYVNAEFRQAEKIHNRNFFETTISIDKHGSIPMNPRSNFFYYDKTQ